MRFPDAQGRSLNLMLTGPEKRAQETPEPGRKVVAHLIEQYAADDMAHGPDNQKSTDQDQVAALLQQRLEVVLEIASFSLWATLRLQDLLQIFSRQRDGLI